MRPVMTSLNSGSALMMNMGRHFIAGSNQLFLGHNIGLDDHYFKPEENYVLREYVKAIDNLTINEENRLSKVVVRLTKKNSELERLEIKHREEIQAMREDMESKFQRIITMIVSMLAI
jgi:hypothetical protein